METVLAVAVQNRAAYKPLPPGPITRRQGCYNGLFSARAGDCTSLPCRAADPRTPPGGRIIRVRRQEWSSDFPSVCARHYFPYLRWQTRTSPSGLKRSAKSQPILGQFNHGWSEFNGVLVTTITYFTTNRKSKQTVACWARVEEYMARQLGQGDPPPSHPPTAPLQEVLLT
ncbi:unnamed protein product [Nesidiocoris tenuis]|uniref:Uncharacterized protein n=1 Tax=Nesidiocoris tenuis TaxID=355587 RepID=A0A6H5FZM1_9HEMI|nr:unnamed protein product [Nesidiocoris tenuis]